MTCIIVRHGAYEDYGRLSALFGREVPVIWDRRPARNRPDTAPSARNPNRREKTPPPSWAMLGFVVVERTAAWTRRARSHGVIFFKSPNPVHHRKATCSPGMSPASDSP